MSVSELCVYFVFRLLWKSPCPCCLWNWSLFLLVLYNSKFLEDDCGMNEMQKIDNQKRVPVIQMYSMCQEACVSRGSAWNQNLKSLHVDWNVKTISHCDLFPTSWTSPESFIEFICSCISSNCEVNLCIVSWFSFNFSMNIHQLLVLEISSLSPTHEHYEFVSRRSFSFIDNSFCRRACSLRDSIYPRWASSNSNLWAQACRWSSSTQFLRDPTWCSCFTSSDLACLNRWSSLPSRRDLPNFDGSAYLKIELSIWFPGSSIPDENTGFGFQEARGSWDEFDIRLSLLEWSAQVCCAVAPLFCIVTASGFPEAVGLREESEIHPRSRIYSSKASIFRHSPSSRSKSALLSPESWSECVCVWM